MLQLFLPSAVDYRIVALSLAIAIFTACQAMNLVEHVTTESRRKIRNGLWLFAGACAIGTGLWLTHFVGMLGLKGAPSVTYAAVFTLAAWGLAITVAWFALYLCVQSARSIWLALLAALFMTAGSAGVHYTGMYAMHPHKHVAYNPLILGSVLTGVLLAFAAALLLCFQARNVYTRGGLLRKYTAGLIIGITFFGMHFGGLAAGRDLTNDTIEAGWVLSRTHVAELSAIAIVLLLCLSFLASILDQRRKARLAKAETTLRRENTDLYFLHTHDPLTQLPNHNQLHNAIESSLKRWRQEKVRFAVIHIDLDDFRTTRNNLGSRHCDKLLKRIANGLIRIKYPDDVVARTGADEFVFLLNDLANRESVSKTCARITETISAIPVNNAHISASLGSATCPDNGAKTSDLLSAAEQGLHAAKKAGKNNSQAYRPDMTRNTSRDIIIQAELAAAIKSGHLIPYYQPKYTPDKQRIIGAEALARWQQRKSGVIGPAHFMPVAEKYGLVIDLERCILDTVCRDIRQWLDEGLEAPSVSVNMSIVRIRETDFPEQVQACLKRHKLPPEYLFLEITETMLVEDIEQTINTLSKLNNMGVRISLDDFGTGYSSLSYLSQLPAHQLKIDQYFISKLGSRNTTHRHVVQFIIEMAHALQLTVVAEGVETEKQLTYLDDMRCDEIQGFLLSHPLPGRTFAEQLQPSVTSGNILPFSNRPA